MAYTKGLDVSYYEPKINWASVRSHGYLFMFTKATQGIGYVDSRFNMHWTNARAAGLLRGAYHYLEAGQDATRQADLFLHTIGADQGELPAVLDLEGAYNDGVTNKQFLGAAEIWLKRVEKFTGRKPIIYSGYYFLKDRVSMPRVGGAPPWAKDYTLWLAQYLNHPAGENDTPLQPKGWQDWTFWQHSEKGLIEGVTADNNIPTAVDLNYFRGSEDDLYAFAGVKKGDHKVDPVVIKDEPKKDETKIGKSTPPIMVPVIHRVQAGESLSVIAMSHHTTVDAIVRLNNITNPNLIQIGQVLVMPS